MAVQNEQFFFQTFAGDQSSVVYRKITIVCRCVAQLAEWSFSKLEVRRLNPVIRRKKLKNIFLLLTVEMNKIKKRGREWSVFEKRLSLLEVAPKTVYNIGPRR